MEGSVFPSPLCVPEACPPPRPLHFLFLGHLKQFNVLTSQKSKDAKLPSGDPKGAVDGHLVLSESEEYMYSSDEPSSDSSDE